MAMEAFFGEESKRFWSLASFGSNGVGGVILLAGGDVDRSWGGCGCALGGACDCFLDAFWEGSRGFCRLAPSKPNCVGGVAPLAVSGDDRKSIDDRVFD